MMDPHFPTVDAMVMYGEEVWFFVEGTCTCKSIYSIQRGR